MRSWQAPSSIATIVSILVAFIALVISAVSLQVTNDALYLATSPHVEIVFNHSSETIHIVNPGPRPLHDVLVQIVAYDIPMGNLKPAGRNAPAGGLQIKTLESGGKIPISENYIKTLYSSFIRMGHRKDIILLPHSLQAMGVLPIAALVVTFRREIDGRRFLHWEPIRPWPNVIPLFSDPHYGSSGEDSEVLDKITEVELRERRLRGITQPFDHKQ